MFFSRKTVAVSIVFAIISFAWLNVHGKNENNFKNTITRDNYGIWSIKSPDRTTAFKAMGYAVAKDRLWQLELFRRSSRGELAEVFGTDYLELDVFMRTINYSEAEIQAAYNALPLKYSKIIEAYVNGINIRIDEVTQDETILPIEYKALAFTPKKWTVTDALAFQVYLMRSFDCEALYSGQMDNAVFLQELAAKFPDSYYSMYSDLRWNRDPKSQTMIPEDHAKKIQHSARRAKIIPVYKSKIRDAGEKISKQRKRNIKKLKEINAYLKMGSYAWAVSGRKTASGNPILYSGPEMGFSVPAIITEGAIDTCGYKVSGMLVPGLPAVLIGRTPYHAWSLQVGHAHTVDYYTESAENVELNRYEVIKVAGEEDVTLPVYRTSHGPVVYPMPYNPEEPGDSIVSWKYSQWGYELSDGLKALHKMGNARTMRQFGNAVSILPVSQHICYIDRYRNIAYWMSGKDPDRLPGIDTSLPQSGDGTQEWLSTYKPNPHDENPRQGFYAGWNNKASSDYDNPNVLDVFYFGPFHRAHIMRTFFSSHDNLTYQQVRDFSINASTTDSFALGGNPWVAVKQYFINAVLNNPTEKRLQALDLLENWNGHIVDGDPADWVTGMVCSDSWVLEQEWILEVLQLTFYDELETQSMTGDSHDSNILFGALVHALENDPEGVVNKYDWFQNTNGSGPSTANEIIVTALDNVLNRLGSRPWNVAREEITFTHDILGYLTAIPFANRSTYAQCVEMGWFGPVRIETMFPLGESGSILGDLTSGPVFDTNFFSLQALFNTYTHKNFPLFY